MDVKLRRIPPILFPCDAVLSSEAMNRRPLNRRMKPISLLISLILLEVLVFPALAEEPAAGGARAPEPVYSFIVEKKRFINPDGVTSPTMFAEALADLEESGWSEPAVDEDAGLQYITRRSAVEIVPDNHGDLVVYEAVLVRKGTRDIFLRKRPLDIPIVTKPEASGNLLLARHPLAMVLPEFQELIEFEETGSARREGPSGKTRIYTNTWMYELNQDSETGQLSGLTQYHRKSGKLLKHVAFEGWHEAPSGRTIPSNVYVRTYRGSQNQPVVELHFLDVQENKFSKAAPVD